MCEHQLCVVASALPIVLLLTAPFRGNVPQSNMEYSVNKAFNASAEIADSVHYPDPRFVTFSARSAASWRRYSRVASCASTPGPLRR